MKNNYEKMRKKFLDSLDTKQWLGVADAHIANPETSLMCSIRYRLCKIFRRMC